MPEWLAEPRFPAAQSSRWGWLVGKPFEAVKPKMRQRMTADIRLLLHFDLRVAIAVPCAVIDTFECHNDAAGQPVLVYSPKPSGKFAQVT